MLQVFQWCLLIQQPATNYNQAHPFNYKVFLMFELYKEYTAKLASEVAKSVGEFTKTLTYIKAKDKKPYRMVISQQSVDRDGDVVLIE